jgi:hypothetical protein
MEILIPMPRSLKRIRTLAAATSIAILSALCIVPLDVAAAEGDSLEYAVKSAYLYKFGIYVEWPPGAFASQTSPLNLCIVGEDPFGSTLDAAVNGQHIESHPIAIRRMKTLTRDAGCHILYSNLPEVHRSVEGAQAARNGVLTVSDVRGVGIINFVVKDNRVRFEVDEEAAAQNGLTISSKLLGIALNVKPRKGK